ncbi:thyrotropin-releasing hormone receptor-like [Antedon mediterranea]|uniref:thyrotropin-releasing hormone receptor-like n=1 Tax=Antedon mediterranea TaxID=105859 RepID=UPI003AF82C76
MADGTLIKKIIRQFTPAGFDGNQKVTQQLHAVSSNDSDGEYCFDLSEEMSATFLYMEVEEIVTVFVLPIILILGLSTNSAFLFVVGKVNAMRTVTNAYLVNLAVGDMIFLIVVISDKLWSYMTSELVQDHSARSVFGCITLNVLNYTCLFTCELLITAVAIERYYAICYPFKSAQMDRTNLCRNVIISIWVVSACFALTMTPCFCILSSYCLSWPEGEKYEGLPNEWVVCNYVDVKARIYGDFLRTVPFFVALIVNTVLYSLVVVELNRNVQDESHPRAKINRKTRNQVATMLVINTTVFFALMSPFNIFSVILIFDSHRTTRVLSPEGRRIYILFARLLTYCNSVINPVIYKVTNARYRKAFYIAFGCSKKKSDVPSIGMETDNTNTSSVYALEDRHSVKDSG